MHRRLPPSMLVLSPGTLTRGAPGSAAGDELASFPVRLREVVRAGGSGLVLREPFLEDGPFLELALEARALLDREAPGAWLGIHDRVHLAGATAADGVHLAGGSLSAAEARRVLGDKVTLGVSTHQGDGPDRWEGADYAMHAPVFAPHSKDVEVGILGPEGLREFCAACPLPVWALGGVNPASLPRLRGTGAAGAAAIGAVWGQLAGVSAAGPDAVRAEEERAASPGLPQRVDDLVAAAAATFMPSDEAKR